MTKASQRTNRDDLLVLASTSSFRKALLTAAGLPFVAEAPGVDEDAPPRLTPKALARKLALAKALAVARRHPSSLVVGSDQTADLAGRLLRKPDDRKEARRQLASLSGRTHRLHTALAVVRLAPPLSVVEVESVRLTMRRLSASEIDAYLRTGEWKGCAGAYRLEAQGVKLMRRVQGDYHAVIGLPLLRLVRILARAGFPLFGRRSA